MATRLKMDASVMPAFKVETDPRDDWLKWKRALERFFKVNKIEDDEEKHDLLLVIGGLQLQEYYDKIAKYEVQMTAEGGEIVILEYESAITSLDKYFAPQTNKRFERHMLRSMKQKEQELFEDFVFRVQDQARRCMFTDVDDCVVDQLIEGCRSSELRKKLLSEDVSLVEAITYGKTIEDVQKQTREYERPSTSYADSMVQRVENRRQNGPGSSVNFRENQRCYNCNKTGHLAREFNKCPATQVNCLKCGTKGHFAVCCHKRKREASSQPPAKRVNAVMPSSSRDHIGDRGIFTVDLVHNQNEFLELDVGGVVLRMVIDSGSVANIVNEKTYNILKENSAHILNETDPKPEDTNLTAFASNQKIQFTKSFEAEIKVPGEKCGIWSHILVAPHGQTSLLSKGTAFALGVLKIGYNVNKVTATETSLGGANVFPKVPDVLVQIRTDESVKPVIQAARRFPISMEAEVESKILQLLEQNIIERAEGPYSWISPLVPVRKTDGKIRLCVDMRAANKAVLRENYPMPNIDFAMTSITKVAKLSKIDLEAAYYHFELAPDSRDITTFAARSGVYRFCRLLFGIKSAPERFQMEMENLFRGIKGLIVYMDDLLVYGATEEDHDRTLEEVMRRLKKMNMKINEQKSIFGVKEVVFLGHRVSTDGVRPTTEKIDAILELRNPTTQAELRSLLGLLNFVGKFIPNLSAMTFHMRSLLTKGSVFKWEAKHSEELQTIKNTIGKVESLGYFDPNDKTLLITDASPFGLGGILIQTRNNASRTIACISKSLADHEKKYCQTEKECLAIIWAMEKLYIYLYGLHFTLITDCKPLEYLFNKAQSKPSARIERWILRLLSFDFSVRYEPGESNLADALSRLGFGSKVDTGEPDVIAWLSEEIRPKSLSIKDIEEATQQDEELQRLKNALLFDCWDDVGKEYSTATIRENLSLYGELILRGDRILIPSSLRQRVIDLAHLGHQGSTAMRAQLRAKVWFPTMDKMIELTVKQCKPCRMTSLPDKPNPMERRIPTEPWQDLAIDFKEGLPGDLSLLVVVCYTTRFVQIEPMRPATTQKVIGALLRMFSMFGIPRSITADNGPQFKAEEFRGFCTSYGIHLNLSTPYWPEQNGGVERQMRNIGKRIKISSIQGSDWKEDLYEYLMLYHSTPQETTGRSPGSMMFGREIQTRIPTICSAPSLDLEEAKDKDMMMKDHHKQRANEKRGAKEHQLKEGDVVLMRNIKKGALQPNFNDAEYNVVGVKGGEISIKSKESGKIYKRNSSHLKTLLSSKEDERVETEENRPVTQKRRRTLPARLQDFVIEKD